VENGHHVADVHLEIDVRSQHVRTLAEAGHRGCVHLVAVSTEDPGHTAVAPTAVSPTVNKDERRHPCGPFQYPALIHPSAYPKRKRRRARQRSGDHAAWATTPARAARPRETTDARPTPGPVTPDPGDGVGIRSTLSR